MEPCGSEKHTEVLLPLQLMKQGLTRKSCLQSPIIQDFCMAEHQTGLAEMIQQLGDYNYVLVGREHNRKRRDSFQPGRVVALIFRSGFSPYKLCRLTLVFLGTLLNSRCFF